MSGTAAVEPTRPLLTLTFLLLAINFVLIFSSLINLNGTLTTVLTVSVGFVFMLIHGSNALGVRNTVVFLVILMAVSFFAEVFWVHTGLLFGRYYYTDNLGPKILGVPLLIPISYVAMGYASLITARIILGLLGTPRRGKWFPTTIVAMLLMVAWDVCIDPYDSTVGGNWIWLQGGPYFGVGIHNYVGWCINIFVIMFLYQWYANSHEETGQATFRRSAVFWAQPVIYYAITALDTVLVPLVGGVSQPFASPNNYTGSVDALVYSLSLIAFFVMGTPAIIAFTRLSVDKSLTADR